VKGEGGGHKDLYSTRLFRVLMRRTRTFVGIGTQSEFYSAIAERSNPDANIILIEMGKDAQQPVSAGSPNSEIAEISTSEPETFSAQSEPYRSVGKRPNCRKHYVDCRAHTWSSELHTLLCGEARPLLAAVGAAGAAALHHALNGSLPEDFCILIHEDAGIGVSEATSILSLAEQMTADVYVLDDHQELHCKITKHSVEKMCHPNRDVKLLCFPRNLTLNVLFFSHVSSLGGAERSLLELVNELVSDYWFLCTVVCPGEGPLPTALRDAGAALVITQFWWWCDCGEHLEWLRESLRSLSLILPTLAIIDPDAVFTQTLVIPWGGLTAAILRKPHVWSVCEYGEKDHGFIFTYPFQDVIRFVQESSALIFTALSPIAEELFPQVSPDRISVLHRYIPVPQVSSLSAVSDLWVMSEATRIGVFALIREGKGQEDIVQAASILKRRGMDVEVVIAGHANPYYLAKLHSLARELDVVDVVRFHEFLPDPYPAIRMADIVVSCSRCEAFGRTVAEAMLLERPIVYTAAGGYLDYMIDGETGLAYDPGDVEALADQLERLILDPDLAARLAQQAARRARSLFTREGYGGRVAGYLRRLPRMTRSSLGGGRFFEDVVRCSLEFAVEENRETGAGQELGVAQATSDVIGHIDQALVMRDGSIHFHGWAFDKSNSSEPVTVVLFYEGFIIHTQQASGERPDVASHFPSFSLPHVVFSGRTKPKMLVRRRLTGSLGTGQLYGIATTRSGKIGCLGSAKLSFARGKVAEFFHYQRFRFSERLTDYQME
jgi:glycosyltransferase involved in cell wall biosynthesis